MTPQEIEAQAGTIEQLLAAHGVTMEGALTEEGRERARPHFERARERAERYGYTELARRIDDMVEKEAQAHARRGMRRTQPGTAPETLGGRPGPVAPPLPVSGTFDPMPLRGSVFGPSVARNVSDAPRGEPPPQAMPPTLTGQENAPSPPMPVLPPPPDRPGTVQNAAQPQSPAQRESLYGGDNTGMNLLLGVSGLGAGMAASEQFARARETGSPSAALSGVGHVGMAALPFARTARTALGLYGGGSALAGNEGIRAGAENILGSFVGEAQAQGRRQPSETTRRLQQKLSDEGYYKGPIDGITGDATDRANERYQADQRAARQQDIERLRSEGEIERARGEREETGRKKAEGERKAQERGVGEKRLRDIEENMPLGTRAWQAASPLVGAGVGVLGAYLGRAGLGSAMSSIARNKADRADELMAAGARGSVPDRVGRVNQFWSEGARGRQEPFTFTAGRKPYPYAVNPDAPAASQLYHPGLMSRVGPGAAVGGAGAGEWYAAQTYLVEPARQELTAAREAVGSDPSEANIQRLQDARNAMARADFAMNLGRAATLLGFPAAEAKAWLKYAPPRPNVSDAENQRGLLAQLLGGRGVVRGGQNPPRGATWNEASQRWMLNGSFIGGPNRWPPPK